jgi:hypothetical protein
MVRRTPLIQAPFMTVKKKRQSKKGKKKEVSDDASSRGRRERAGISSVRAQPAEKEQGNQIAEKKTRTANTPIPSKCAAKRKRKKKENKTELHLPSSLRNMSPAHRKREFMPGSVQDISREREKKRKKHTDGISPRPGKKRRSGKTQ